MRKDSVKIVLSFLSMALMSCSSGLTIEKVDDIIKKQFIIDNEKELVRLNKVYENQDEFKNEIIKNNQVQFNQTLALRGKVIDSLKMLNYDKSVIIESTKDLNGSIVIVQYFFFNNRIYSAGYNTEIVTKNGESFVTNEVPIINETTFKDLKTNYQNDILEIYNHFNKDNFSLIEDSFDCTPSFGSYNVIVIIRNKIGYYGVKAQEKCYVETFHN